ncbi:DUF3343 domain-containing protein [Eubacterium oxidoreducens]|uniref:Putative Se/S carrier protein-like domain-containing protein n=1 Tax=Eubacterium oxidoreducens TaxID=1732 RepID=A0A1G6BFR8_EUBOX|nr:DUF3343 domain-containing protein [Eubacterium oxidoreducens]SDB19472.1 Protein of unknown function [Eubacterium oxidoreducens]
MTEDTLNYYILFETYTQGMELQQMLRKEQIPSRIAPTPRSIQGELGCGMSILLKEEHLEDAKACIKKNKAEYYDLVGLKPQINPKRDRYC